MLWMRANLILSTLLVSLLLSVVSVSADVIILKNGRRIVADSVTEAGDKVVYELFGGNVTIPKSLVDRIEKGGYAPQSSRPAPRRGTGDLDPGKQLSTEIRLPDMEIESIVRDGAVDEQYLQTLARAANTGELARQNAVNAYLVAASFEARKQRFNQASQWAEQALRLSRANTRRLKVGNGAYLKVSYGEASVLACLRDDPGLDDETIRMDQTLRTAICLEKIMQGSAAKELVYGPGSDEVLKHPVVIERSAFRGPTPLARLVKQQYLICLVHHAIARDMETPIACLTNSSMEVVGIQTGDKVLLISEKTRKPLRCLLLDPKGLPLESMRKYFTLPCPDTEYQDLLLPWVTIDLQTRLDLGVDPWQPIIVGRDPGHAIVSEFGQVVLGVAPVLSCVN